MEFECAAFLRDRVRRLAFRRTVWASLLGATVASHACVAQQGPAGTTPAPGAAKADISKEALVIEKLLTRIRAEADGTDTRETTARVRVLADAGVKEMAVLTFTYTASNQQEEIAYVRVIKPDGTVVVTPEYNVQDMPADVKREAPMYSDIHQKHVAVKGLGVGDTLEYKATLRTLKPEVPGHFWLEYSFEKDAVVLDEQLDLDVPADKKVTVASKDVQPAVTTSGGRKLYHWASANPKRPDPDAPAKSLKHWKPSVQVTTFASWAEVGAWYQALQKDQLAVTPAIQAKANELTKGLTSDDEKIRSIFAAVALKTHYVGLSFGIGRYQPHPADDVLSNEYGDCKDKHTLLATLLKAAGIQAWPVLISSGRELDPDTPSPAQFDHVITAVAKDGKLVWMDATTEVAPVGALMLGLRDKQALAVPPDKPAYLERTPADLPYPQMARFEASGKLDEKGQFTGHFSQTYRGDMELLMRAAFRQVPQSLWKQFLQRVSGSMGFGGEVKEPEVSPVEQTDQPFHFAYDYTRERYGEWDDQRIGPAMPPVGWELMPGVKTTKPGDDVEIGSPGEQVYISKIQLPNGYTIFPASKVDLREDWAEYHASYSFQNGTFTAERRLVFKKNKVPLADWNKYVAFREAIYADTAKMVPVSSSHGRQNSLDSLNLPPTERARAEEMMAEIQQILPLREVTESLAADTPPTGEALTKILETCRKAVSDYESHSQQTAADDLPTLEFPDVLATGWTALGWAEWIAKDLPNAESHLRAAWKLTQTPLPGYLLAHVLEARGDKAEAAHMYELASISESGGVMGNLARGGSTRDFIVEDYKKLTGHELKATSLKDGAYKGSLRAELDKEIEIHQYVPSTKLNGQGFYAVTYEAGKPIKARALGGDKGMASLTSMLENRRFPVILPEGSKATLVREVKLICSPWGGCDAYMLLPARVEMPVKSVATRVISKDASKGTKTVQIKYLPVGPPPSK